MKASELISGLLSRITQSDTPVSGSTLAKEFNVSGTPAFIIDGEILHGAPTSKGLIESYLK